MSKYASKRAAALRIRTRRASARNTLRRFARRIRRPTRPISMGFLTGKVNRGRLRFRGRLGPRSVDKGTCTLMRKTYATAIFNNTTVDDYATWRNADPTLSSLLMPGYWQLWNEVGQSYITPTQSTMFATEVGSSATGGAGAAVRGRMRFTHQDCMLPADLKNWESVRLDYITLAITYMRSDCDTGNDASGITPLFEYFNDVDGTFIQNTGAPEQDTVVELNRRPITKRIKLTPNVTRYITVRPNAFKVIAPDSNAAWALGGAVPVGYVDPNSDPQMAQPYNWIQFQIRNMQLPNAETAQTSMVKIVGSYHYTCKQFIGQSVN